MRKVILAALFLSIGFVACNDKKEQKQETTQAATTEATMHHGGNHHNHPAGDAKDLNTVATKHSVVLKPVLDAYFQTKQALQNDDQTKATETGKALVQAVKAVQANLTTETAKATIAKIEAEATGIVTGDIKTQRAHFEALSHDLKGLIQEVGTDRVVYQQYCPMYEKKGGTWLSDQQELLNPLYGASMLKCGMTQEMYSPEVN
ncbi:DUF3347 domain-containing protein [Myroides pelagicus]|uniref:DUF3347 domain-containing protein n=1 Tax=Myroides pelagicus TaxID=270914 RepID=A0A7K1GLM3_9FLAO|nr:DUF3347 domain-containing protein [Myroides pelagicus]MEC4114193.1 DUF3347 domain-containing protein [Myroides pelagicus]MTH29751.1 DUF3347 domain-containing protein [Myroides pelagicus]